MTSLYEALHDDIPMFVVPGTEDSDVVEYETAMQRNVRLFNEARIKQEMEDMERLRIQALVGRACVGPWGQKRLPEAN